VFPSARSSSSSIPSTIRRGASLPACNTFSTRRSPLLSMSVAFMFIRCYQSLTTTSNLSSNYRGAAIISVVQGRNNQNGNIDLGDLNSNSDSFLFVVCADS
jgi:hypothetical protein